MNIVKHAQAKSVLLRVTTEHDRLSVIVRDDGVGIDEDRIETPQSHGLLGMRHRVEALDGTLGIQSLGRGVGTECRFTLAARAHPQHGYRLMKHDMHVRRLDPARRLRRRVRRSASRRNGEAAVAPAIISPQEVADPAQPPSYEVAIAGAAADRNTAKERCAKQPESVRAQCEQEANAAFSEPGRPRTLTRQSALVLQNFRWPFGDPEMDRRGWSAAL